MVIGKLFFLVFGAPGRSQTLKIKPNRRKGVQKRGSHFFKKNCFFLQQLTKNDFPRDPQRLLNLEKMRETILQNQILKTHGTTPQIGIMTFDGR